MLCGASWGRTKRTLSEKEVVIMKKKITSIVLAAVMGLSVISLAGCTGNTSSSGSSESSSDADASSTVVNDDTLGGASFADSKQNVTVKLSTDKTEYAAGEKVKYNLIIENDRTTWNADSVTISSITYDPLVSESQLPANILSSIAAGSRYEYTGVLSDDAASAYSGEAAKDASEGKVYNGTSLINIAPYVKFKYNGEDVLLRFTMQVTMNQEKLRYTKDQVVVSTDTCCHDPSIFKDKDGTYYIFGTHMTCSKTTDLINWTNLDNAYRSSYDEETRNLIRAYNDDESSGSWYSYLWAPDIIYNEAMGKYCMYLSANGDYWQSNIVLLTADEVMGPYEYAGTVVYGGFTSDLYDQTDVEKVTGESTIPDRYVTNGVANRKWGDKWPNCIDPCVFYDEEGKLWMSYGSWSGGIFMLELDENTGLRDYDVTYATDEHSDAYFGTKIAGGWYVSGEASYIQHIGDYYYLFISYGNLEAKGGYNVRVFRSESPDGPYVDELGTSAIFDKLLQNFNARIGVRLFGGYKWRFFSVGEVAQGHNSAFVDDDGKAYIVFHTRTTDGTEGHHVKVHQLFVNEDGWLVAAPFAYGGETLKEDGYSAEEYVGDYEVMIHMLDIDYANLETTLSNVISLNEDGTVSGYYTGTWESKDGTAYITLKINNEEYHCVALKMCMEGSNIETMVFTGLGLSSQFTIWGSRMITE